MQAPVFVGNVPGRSAWSEFAGNALGSWEEKQAAQKAKEEKLAAEELARMKEAEGLQRAQDEKKAAYLAKMMDERPELIPKIMSQVPEKDPRLAPLLSHYGFDIPLSGYDEARVRTGELVREGKVPDSPFYANAANQWLTGKSAPASVLDPIAQREVLGEEGQLQAMRLKAKLDRTPQEIAVAAAKEAKEGRGARSDTTTKLPPAVQDINARLRELSKREGELLRSLSVATARGAGTTGDPILDALTPQEGGGAEEIRAELQSVRAQMQQFMQQRSAILGGGAAGPTTGGVPIDQLRATLGFGG